MQWSDYLNKVYQKNVQMSMLCKTFKTWLMTQNLPKSSTKTLRGWPPGLKTTSLWSETRLRLPTAAPLLMVDAVR